MIRFFSVLVLSADCSVLFCWWSSWSNKAVSFEENSIKSLSGLLKIFNLILKIFCAFRTFEMCMCCLLWTFSYQWATKEQCQRWQNIVLARFCELSRLFEKTFQSDHRRLCDETCIGSKHLRSCMNTIFNYILFVLFVLFQRITLVLSI